MVEPGFKTPYKTSKLGLDPSQLPKYGLGYCSQPHQCFSFEDPREKVLAVLEPKISYYSPDQLVVKFMGLVNWITKYPFKPFSSL